MSAIENGLAGARERVLALLELPDADAAREQVAGLHASDVADVLESLEEPERLKLLSLLPVEVASEALAEMEEGGTRAELLAALEPDKRTELLAELADDDVADLIAELEPAEQRKVLEELPVQDATELLDLLSYDEDTAGGLMTTEVVSIERSRTAAEAIEEVRRQGREVENFYTIFVVDADRRLQGTLRLDRLIMADPSQPIAELVEEPAATVLPSEDQEQVGRLIARYNLASIAVVDEDRRLLGRITFDDVIDVMEAEQTEDILRMAGLGDEEGLRYTWSEAVRARLPWLGLNLLIASLSAFVVWVFSDTI
ncbi:MAG TPA: CBS domain-containing protein, partial [Longimicrobiales bacterium]|nr:CBS domain-containing protein [Longimicrobiales bacterium]